MATYRLHIKNISRDATGEKIYSSVAAAAYRAEENLKDEQKEMIFDYSKKNLCLHNEIITPENAPDKFKKRNLLWNEVEKVEKRKDARLTREFQLSLPQELKLKQQKELVQNFCKKELVSKGMICDIAIHTEKKKNKNYHAHVLTTLRNIEKNGFGKKNRDWNDKELATIWRKSWEKEVNKALKEQNIKERVNCLSNEKRGLEPPKNKTFRQPTIRHFSKVAKIIEKENLYEIKETENKEIKAIFYPPAKINNKPTFKLERTKNYFLKNIKYFLSKKFLEKIKKEIQKINTSFTTKNLTEKLKITTKQAELPQQTQAEKIQKINTSFTTKNLTEKLKITTKQAYPPQQTQAEKIQKINTSFTTKNLTEKLKITTKQAYPPQQTQAEKKKTEPSFIKKFYLKKKEELAEHRENMLVKDAVKNWVSNPEKYITAKYDEKEKQYKISISADDSTLKTQSAREKFINHRTEIAKKEYPKEYEDLLCYIGQVDKEKESKNKDLFLEFAEKEKQKKYQELKKLRDKTKEVIARNIKENTFEVSKENAKYNYGDTEVNNYIKKGGFQGITIMLREIKQEYPKIAQKTDEKLQEILKLTPRQRITR